MPDEIDRGNDTAELFLDLSLSTKKPAGPAPTGCCLNCDEPLALGERWCDVYCRDDWVRRNNG
jgi:hypothetical protein